MQWGCHLQGYSDLERMTCIGQITFLPIGWKSSHVWGNVSDDSGQGYGGGGNNSSSNGGSEDDNAVMMTGTTLYNLQLNNQLLVCVCVFSTLPLQKEC
ncbi:hypothetical protein RJT34_11127 [Clitoria ternatea]|uniref:Uncharacterized protein n=1 Tax=Clitoria ternatea TaxID=43366 RepID=A0AAN9JJC3_CLITE